MSDYKQRLKHEWSDLINKLNSLAEFINTLEYNNLSYEDRSLLRDQYLVMKKYSGILELRMKK